MWSAKIPQISALLAALVLTLGLVTHGFASASMPLKAGVTAATDVPMSGDMPMPGKCNGCAGDEKGMVPSACSVFCSTAIASPSLPPLLDAVPIETLRPATEPNMTGRVAPPDPHPPRPTILN
jgi:hypothetical protein